MPSPTRITRLALLVYGPLAGAAVAWAWRADRRLAWTYHTPWLEASYTLRLLVSLGLGLGLGLLVTAVTPLLVEHTRWARSLHGELEKLISPLSRAEIALLALASGFGEELFFRGAMQPTLGLLLTSLIFGAAHLGPKPVFAAWALWATAIGFAFGLLFEATGILWGPVLSHVWINHRNMTFIGRH